MATQDYVLNGTTTFTFPFAVRSASVLTLELVPGGVVSTGDYTVVGAGPTSTGVTVTYPNAPTSATTVLRITRYVQPDRATTLNGPSDITVANLNAEFDNAYDAIADFQVAGVNIAQAVLDAEAAEAAAQAAQGAAEAAAAGVNLPSIVGGDTGKILRVNGAEDGYELTAALLDGEVTTAKLADAAVTAEKIDPSIWLTAAGTYGVDVVTTPVAAHEYGTIQAALAAVLSANIPAGGYVEIHVIKTALALDDYINVPEGADYRFIRMRFRAATYTVPPDAGNAFVSVGYAARGPRIWLTGSATLSIGAGTNGISVLEDGELFISGSSVSYTLTINSANGPVTIRGGRVYVRDIDLTLTSDFAALRIRHGGEVTTDSDTSTISATCSTVNEAAIVLQTGSRLSCKGATATSGHANAVAVSSGSDAILQDLSATSTGTRVLATAAGMINLNGSAATCNLTNNTVSTNGILIR